MNKLIYGLVGVAVVAGILSTLVVYTTPQAVAPEAPVVPEEIVACTLDAMQCPDGSFVGRSGPNCEFVCPAMPEVPADVAAAIAAKADLITLSIPAPLVQIESGVSVTGQARGGWFFEGSFPVVLTDWDGKIIAEGPATAQGEWMTSEFVPFSATLSFVSPYTAGDPDFMSRGTLILKKDNPSGLPENDDALEVPVRFVQMAAADVVAPIKETPPSAGGSAANAGGNEGVVPPPDEGVICTADAMQCPDGSFVGRSGPACEFKCPAAI